MAGSRRIDALLAMQTFDRNVILFFLQMDVQRPQKTRLCVLCGIYALRKACQYYTQTVGWAFGTLACSRAVRRFPGVAALGVRPVAGAREFRKGAGVGGSNLKIQRNSMSKSSISTPRGSIRARRCFSELDRPACRNRAPARHYQATGE